MSINSVHQTVLPSLRPSVIPIFRYSRRHAGQAAAALLSTNPEALGVSISQKDDGEIDFIAISTPDAVYVMDIDDSDSRGSDFPLDQSFKTLLGSTTITLAGFGMPRIVLRLHHQLQYHVRGIDLSTLCSPSGKAAWRPSKVISQKVCYVQDPFPVDRLWHENNQQASIENLCLRAWLSVKVAQACRDLVEVVRKVDTRHVRKDILKCLGNLLRQTDVLSRAQPRENRSEYEKFTMTATGEVELQNARYKTRVRKSKQARVIMTNESGREYMGAASHTRGKMTSIKFQEGAKFSGQLQEVRVIGLDDPAASEKARDDLLLRALQDECKLTDARFIRYLWFPTSDDANMLLPSSHETFLALPDLNSSQNEVVDSMTSDSPLVIVHGPPGTGKTTTIAAATEKTLESRSLSVWIIGHSNVSVKNIAEKLFKRSIDFKLIVSKEFYVEWHEHIYEAIQHKVIRADELPDDRFGLSRVIGSSRVILSTLGMLSNPALDDNGMFLVVPVQRLIVDEASQINVFEYMHIFHKFRPTLQKVCFFGDPKQLPPFGQERAKTLQSIFEIQHLQRNSYFLDVQYRMPTPLGSFISQEVYGSRLKSSHKISDCSCVRFVDVPAGEEGRAGLSWTNDGEIATIVHLVRYYYQTKDFCIITPYDAQRAAIQKALERDKLPGWDRVFNVDSFQGNEQDYVLISVVRTEHVGFLQSLQRMNVMLTRCRAGMVIVTQKSFLSLVAESTLLGRLAVFWERCYGQRLQARGHSVWASSNAVMNQTVNLPGSPGVHAPRLGLESGDGYSGKAKQPMYTTEPRRFDVKSLFLRRTNPTPNPPSWAQLASVSPSYSFPVYYYYPGESYSLGSPESSPVPVTPSQSPISFHASNYADGGGAGAAPSLSCERHLDIGGEDSFPSLPVDDLYITQKSRKGNSPWSSKSAVEVLKDPRAKVIPRAGAPTSNSTQGHGIAPSLSRQTTSQMSQPKALGFENSFEALSIHTKMKQSESGPGAQTGLQATDARKLDDAVGEKRKKKKNKKRNRNRNKKKTLDGSGLDSAQARGSSEEEIVTIDCARDDDGDFEMEKILRELYESEWQVVGRRGRQRI